MSAGLVGELAGMTLWVEVAFGADLSDLDGSGWTWTDVTADVRQAPGISTALGRGDEAARSQPASLSLVLTNTSGDYSLGGRSAHWPNVRRSTPVRVRLDPDDGTGARTLFLGYADGWTPGWDDGPRGQVPVVTLSASGTLRRLQQGQTPLRSPFSRYLPTLSSLVAYWPLEENDGATVVSSGLADGYPMVFNGSPDFGRYTTFHGTARAADAATGEFQAVVGAYPDSGLGQQVRALMSFPDDGLPDGTVLMHCHLTGTLGRIDVTWEVTGGVNRFGVFRYNSDGTLNGSDEWNLNSVPILGRTGRFSLEIRQAGSNVEWNIGWMNDTPGSALVNSGGGAGAGGFQVVTGKTCGRIQFLELTPHGDAAGLGIGQVSVENTISSQFLDGDPLQGYYGERPARDGDARITRLCQENDVPVTIYGDNSSGFFREGMGYQPVATLLDVLRECEDVDLGQLWDGRDLGLSYSSRRYRETGDVVLTLDAAAGELAPPFAPVDDDQRTRNSVTATRVSGTTATVEDVDGPLGVDAIGRYDDSVTLNSSSDAMMAQHAGFRVALGTVEGYRVPALTVDLAATPYLAGAVLDLVPGDRVQVANPAAVLGSFPEPTVDLLVEGIAHELGAARWVVTLACSAAGPWVGAEVAGQSGDTSDLVLRADTDGSTVSTTAPRNATTLAAATPSGPLWTTVADDFPLYLDVGGIRVRATACSGTSSPQTFTVDPLPTDRSSGTPITLWDQRPLAL